MSSFEQEADGHILLYCARSTIAGAQFPENESIYWTDADCSVMKASNVTETPKAVEEAVQLTPYTVKCPSHSMQSQIVCAGKVGVNHGVEADNFVRYIIVQFINLS